MSTNFRAFDPTNKTYFKRNFGDALSKITPTVYSIKDFDLSGLEFDPLDLILQTHINACNNISNVLYISATDNFPEIDNINGIYPFFIKQNNNTNITPFSFEKGLLDPFDFQMEEFDTSAEWKSYLDTYLLPSILLNQPSSTIHTPKGLDKDVSASLGVDGASGIHEYLINTLGWFYFLNTSAPTGCSFDPSSYVSQELSKLYTGKTLTTIDGIKGFEEYLWKNYLDSATFQSLELVPTNYISGTDSNTYASGTQNLDRLNTLLEVLYSPLYADNQDFKVKTSFEDYISLGKFTPELVNAGPYSRLLRVLGYCYQDFNSAAEKLESLYDIDLCPEEYLPQLAALIGWELIGSDPGRWRSQIRNAVRIYKAKGTKFATELTLKTLFGENTAFNLSSTLYELHETYVPFLIYYLLATETPHFNKSGYKDNPFNNWTVEKAVNKGVVLEDGTADYSNTDPDSNIRRCVDRILYRLYEENPNDFVLGNKLFPRPGEDPNFVFNYRGRNYNIPPFEEIRYYEKVKVSKPLLETLRTELKAFNVDTDYAASALDYIGSKSISAIDDISLGNTFVLFTSGFELPINYKKVLDDISNKAASYLPLWNSKSSHFDLHLSSNNFSFSKKSETPDTSLGIHKALVALNKTIPAHAIPRVKLFLEALDNVEAFLYSCPIPMHTPLDVFTSSTVVNGYEISGVNMTAIAGLIGVGHGLSSTSPSRHLTDSLSDLMMEGYGGSRVTQVPRNNLRRRTFHTTLPRNGYYDRTGFNMPNSYDPSTFDQFTGVSGGGALTLGYNYSSCEFQTPFLRNSVSSLHPVWRYCETSSSKNTFFGVDTSNTFPWRGAKSVISTLESGNCIMNVRREECPEIIALMHRVMEKDALRNAYDHYKTVSGVWTVSANHSDPIKCLANSAFNGVSSWHQYADYTFGSSIHNVYNYYAKEFKRHGTAPHLVSGINNLGGRNIFSHIYGPLLYNGIFAKDGSATPASGFEDPSYTPITSSILFNANASSQQGTGNLVIGKGEDSTRGEYRYPFGFSGVELCYRTNESATTQPSFECYRPTSEYKRNNPEIESDLLDYGTLVVNGTTSNPILQPRIRFDLVPYGDTWADNILLPDHDIEFNLKIARLQGLDAQNSKIHIWIHTMPENGIFWSWIPKPWSYSNEHHNGEWVANSSSIIEGVPILEAYNNVRKISTPFTLSKTNVNDNDIRYLKDRDFSTFTLKFNTHNRRDRLSSDFKPMPVDYPETFVHRSNQHYVVEVLFEISKDSNDKFVIPEVTMVDKTLANTALDVFTVDYSNDNNDTYSTEIVRTGFNDYRAIFKFMNGLATSSLGQGFATRIASDSSGVFETSGGSRLNYRMHPKWTNYIQNATENYTLIDFKEGT